jgi:MFS family permease
MPQRLPPEPGVIWTTGVGGFSLSTSRGTGGTSSEWESRSLVTIQVLRWCGSGIFGLVSILVTDLTEGSGRFHLTLGAISTAVVFGASLGQVIAGSIVHHFGSNAGFLVLAAAALGILYFFRPETRDQRFLTPTQGAGTR